jgi:hypothetical protein
MCSGFDPYELSDEDVAVPEVSAVSPRVARSSGDVVIPSGDRFDIVKVSRFAKARNTVELCKEFPDLLKIVMDTLACDDELSDNRLALMVYLLDRTTLVNSNTDSSSGGGGVEGFDIEQHLEKIQNLGDSKKTRIKTSQTIKRSKRSK